MENSILFTIIANNYRLLKLNSIMIYKFQNSGTMPQIDATKVVIPPGEYKRTTIQQDHDALVK